MGEDCRAEEGEDVAEPEGGEQQGQRIVYTPVTVIPRPPPQREGAGGRGTHLLKFHLTTGGKGRGRRQEEKVDEGKRPKTRR